MNPWFIVGFLVVCAAAFVGGDYLGHKRGVDQERLAWQTRESAELRDANAMILGLEEKARSDERAHAKKLAVIAAKHQKEIADAEDQKNRDVADARAGRIILRIPAPCQSPDAGASGTASGTPGVGDGAATAELPREVTADLLALADDADAVVRQLSECQAVVREDRGEARSPLP